jgi:hypothetical protein
MSDHHDSSAIQSVQLIRSVTLNKSLENFSIGSLMRQAGGPGSAGKGSNSFKERR